MKSSQTARSKKALEELEALFVSSEHTLDDTLPSCECGGAPRTRYRANSVWIECIKCLKHSNAEASFTLAKSHWAYIVSRRT